MNKAQSEIVASGSDSRDGSTTSLSSDPPPLQEASSQDASEGSQPAPGQDPVATILVVDDVDKNFLAIEAALEGLSCELVMASSGQDALRHLLERDFALILLDVQMPSMDGFETATMIRNRPRTRHVPIIFVTAYGRNADDIRAAYQLGAVDFLFKPLSAEVLCAKASVFLDLHCRNAEVARQSEQLRKNGEMLRAKALLAQRRRLEEDALRQQLAEQEQHSGTLAHKNLELNRIGAALEHSNLALEQADSKKDEFIAILAHELRNPLAAMVSGIELLDKGSSPEEIDALRAVMLRQCTYLSRMVDDLLDVSRLSHGKIELQKTSVRVGTMLDEALEFKRPKLERAHHTLVIRCGCPDAVIYGDSVRLSQVIVNLLSNAIRFTEPGGRIEILADLDESEERIFITIKDNGHGMTQDLVDRIFKMFVQGDAGDGLGIGLAMVRELVEMHEGQVSAHSDGLGLGSEFRVTLPVASRSQQERAKASTLPPAASSRSLRIAVIDDHEDLRELTMSLLQRWGHQVFEAATGNAGIDLVLEKRPDLAIIDIGLPDLLGYEVAERIRGELKELCPRLIAMSGYSQPHDRKRSKEAGFDLHLSKPVKPALLRDALHAKAKSESTT